MRSTAPLPSPRCAVAPWLALVTLAFAPAPARAQAGPADARVDRIFAEYDRPGSPGCALGVARGGRLVYERGYGYANLDYDVPLGARSVFYLASVSKQFTAAAVALAARQRHLSLDDDIRKHLPELRDYGAPITVRHLIHHTSGLRDYLTLMSLAGMRYEDVLADDELLDLVARQEELNFRPGDEFLYSNTGYLLLGLILERATGKSLREYADEQIFRPLGMRNTHFHDDASRILKNRVIGYAPHEEGVRIDHLYNFDKVGDGGLYSTVEDLVLWDQSFYDGRLGGAGFVERLLERGVLNNGDTLSYAFGLTHGSHRGLPTVEHGGALAGFRTTLLRFPDERFSVIVLCNASSARPSTLARRVAELYLADRLGAEGGGSDAASRREGDAVLPAAKEAPPALAPAELRSYAGSYYSEELRATYTLAVEKHHLVLRRGSSEPVPLHPTARNAFATGGGLRLHFQRAANGAASEFTIEAGRVRDIRFVRR